MFHVISGDKGKPPTIHQIFKTKKAAEKAAEKRRQFWEDVRIIESDKNAFQLHLDREE